ncbi:MAG: HlyD family efflux transporter periplasmic adaptor subunit [Bacteroidetes bacterium]|nr:HlyD family efflux transporter periplasmic adaptor subunit [Bacteroidota bacterium]
MRNLLATSRLVYAALVGSWLTASGCINGNERADAYGNFEATETTISSETTGRIVALNIDEGLTVQSGVVAAVVDTVQLSLKRRQLRAARQSALSKTASVRAQIAVIQRQKEVALKDKARIENLLADNAATQKQLDDVTGQISVLDAQEQQIRTQNATILAELEGLDAQVAQLDDQIDRSVVLNPVTGVVLAKYVEPHELTSPGRPLYTIADLTELTLRAYVSGSQLPHVKLGQEVDVQIDEDASSNQTLPGRITWIASEAEFTPKLIQTKEERVNLVYAIKVVVANQNGILKIGMPGEVWFRNSPAEG